MGSEMCIRDSLKRNPSERELETGNVSVNSEETVQTLINVCYKLCVESNDDALLFGVVLQVVSNLRQKKAKRVLLLEGLESAFRVCQSLSRQIHFNEEIFETLASAVQRAKCTGIRNDLKIFCALAFFLKTKLFTNACIFNIGVALESLIKDAEEKSDNLDDIVKMIVRRQRMSGEPESPEVPVRTCLLYTSPSPRDLSTSRMPSSA